MIDSGVQVQSRRDAWQVGEWRVEPNANRLICGATTHVLVPKVMEVLCVLIESAGQPVYDDEFMARVWPHTVVSDASLYQAISQLRKALGDTDTPRRYIDRVSGKGYVLKAPVRRGEPQWTRQPAPLSKWRVSNTVMVVVTGVVVVSLSLALWFLRDRTQSHSAQSELANVQRVAVFPFAIVGATASPYWLHGFADTLVSRLASLQDLQVISQSATNDRPPTSFAPAVNEPIETPTDPSAFDVDALLLGTVQQEGEKLRVNIRFVTNAGASTEHAEVIDGTLGQLFELQDAVATRVLAVVRPERDDIDPEAQAVGEAAWQSYLLGRFHWSKRKPPHLDTAIGHFKQAIEHAADFALAHVGLCDSYHFQYLYGDWPLAKATAACQPLLNKALTINPKLGQTHASLGLLANSKKHPEEARDHFEKATRLAPNYAPGWMWYGKYLRERGEIGEALKHHRKAFSLDPLSPIANRNLAYSLLASGIVHEARVIYSRALELEPNYTNRPIEELEFLPLTISRARAFLNWSDTYADRYRSDMVNTLVKSQVLLSLGRVDSAESELRKIPARFDNHPYFLYTLGLMQLARHDDEAALATFKARMHAEPGNRQRSMPVVALMRYLGQTEAALALFLDRYPEFENTSSLSAAADNIWLFVLLSYLQPDDAAVGSQLTAILNDYRVRSDSTDSWLNALLLSETGKIGEAAGMIERMLDAQWLPNHQEILLPLEREPLFLSLEAKGLADGVIRRLARNRQLALADSVDTID